MKIVKLSAYLQNNVGDDLMAEILINRYPDVYFWGCRGLQKKTKKLEGMAYFDTEDVYARWGRVNHIANFLVPHKKDAVYRIVFDRLERKCICAVAIGGSVYRQSDGQAIETRMKIEEEKKAKDSPFYVIGANFGPSKTQEFYDNFHRYFSTCTGVSFRDKKSYNLFRDIPVVQYAPDVVFNVPQGNVEDDGQHVLISVINLSDRPHLKDHRKLYQSAIAKQCEYFASLGKTPVLVSFCDKEGDEECVNEVYTSLNDVTRDKVLRYYYRGDTEEILEMFRKAHFVVATRFHAMVLALRFGKPLFTISYELKMDNILEETKSRACCKITDVADVSPEKAYSLGKQVVSVDEYVDCAEKQFAQLDRFLLGVR